MTDVPINVQVSDGGSTAEVIAILEQLGLSGEQAAERLASGYRNVSEASSAADSAQRIFGAGVTAAISDTKNLSTAIDALTTEERIAASSTQNITKLIQFLGTASAQTASSVSQATGSVTQATAAFGRLGSTLGGINTFAGNANVGIQSLNATNLQGSNAATAFRNAVASGASAFTNTGASLAQLGASARVAIGSLGALASAYTAVNVASKLIDASDTFTNVTNALRGMGLQGQTAKAVFDSLADTSIATGVDFQHLSQDFVDFAVGGQRAGLSITTINAAFQSAALLSREYGATTEQTTQFLNTFSRGIAEGGINLRQLNGILQTSPGLFQKIAQSLGVPITAIDTYTRSLINSQDAVDRLQASNQKNTTGEALTAAQFTVARDSLLRLNDEYATAALKVQTLTSQGANLSSATNAQKVAYQTATNNVTIYGNEINTLRTKMGATGTAVADLNAKLLQQKEATAQIEAALGSGHLITVLASLNTEAINASTTFGTTFSQALNAIDVQTVKYVATSTLAQGVLNVFKFALTEVANNMNIVAPAAIVLAGTIGVLTAAFAVLAARIALPILGSFIASLASTGFGILPVVRLIASLGAAFISVGIAVAPVVAAFVGFGIAVIGVEVILAKVADAFSGTTDHMDNLTNSLKSAIDKAKSYGQSLADAAANATGKFTPSVTQMDQALNEANAQLRAAQTGASGLTGALGSNATSANTDAAALTKAADAARDYANAVSNNNSSVTSLNNPGSVDHGTVIPGGAKLFQGIQASDPTSSDGLRGSLDSSGASAGLSSAGYTDLGNGVSIAGGRDGAFVHGGTGTDSVPVMVSPGETLTVQTPMQRRQGLYPTNAPKFANGGTFTPGTSTGVSLGLSGVSVGLASAGSGVTGFTPDQLTTVASAVNDNTAATVDNTDATTAATVSTTTDTTTQSSTATDDTTVTPSLGGGTSGTLISADAYGNASSSSTDTTTTTTPTVVKKPTESDLYTAYQAATGVAVPADGINVPITLQQAQTYVNEDGHWAPRSTINGAVAIALKQAGFRDGGDMYIHGGTGVDSQSVALAVSPGESIHVRTPMQRREAAANGNGGNNHTSNFYISTPDANSFRHSQAQIQSNDYRHTRRLQRKVSGS